MRAAPLCTQFLENFSARNRGIWKKADELRHLPKGCLRAWDQRIFLPLDGWHRLLRQTFPGIDQERFDRLLLGFSTAGAWRPAQDIACFDSSLQASLLSAPLRGPLPVDIFERLPAWCIYFDTGPVTVNGYATNGFFASLEQNKNRDTLFLRLLFLGYPHLAVPFLVPLVNHDLETALRLSNDLIHRNRQATGQTDMEESPQMADAGLKGALNLVLYVCSNGIGNGDNSICRKNVKADHAGWRLMPPPQPRIHHMQEDMGESGTQHQVIGKSIKSSPSPHIRRAHWHGYWKGSLKKGEQRKFELKWLSPFPVAQRNPAKAGDHIDS